MLDFIPDQLTDGQRKQMAYEERRRSWNSKIEESCLRWYDAMEARKKVEEQENGDDWSIG